MTTWNRFDTLTVAIGSFMLAFSEGHVNSVAEGKTLNTFNALTFEFNRDRQELENLGLSGVDRTPVPV